MRWLVVTDIDHTLLGAEGELPEANLAALHEARAAGATVVLATARSYQGALAVHELLELTTPIIVSNGTLILEDANVLYTKALEPAAARGLFDLARASNLPWLLRTPEHGFMHADFDHSRPHFQDPDYYRAGFPDSFENIISLSLHAPRGVAELVSAHDWAARGVMATYYGPDSFDPLEVLMLTRLEASKGTALTWLRRHLGLEDAPVLVMGDSVSDVSMFPLGTSAAPADACAEALAAADWVGPACSHGLVAAALERFVLNPLEPERA